MDKECRYFLSESTPLCGPAGDQTRRRGAPRTADHTDQGGGR
ncbi:hypothetical protein SLNWT_0425 [Streptomyces albus]|uniref:Uncharacterized protein n=1 Tax=Streptomyces albus (strain ATCC 21838 / DSM 41398 / FERM P-419 / JCM 4703 / NBRC 107858) TaxID=1081613 RepID=A0A0B5EPT8_STRA4|nr:hypothetical protein SLNWT_0425 [Streptomyces albus]AOU75112.1 hypothetical protein SLNHY_0421 [Streptomyces albus]